MTRQKPVFPPNRVMRQGCLRGVTHGDCDQHSHVVLTLAEWMLFAVGIATAIWFLTLLITEALR